MEYDQPSPQNDEYAVNYRDYNQEFHVTGVAGTGMVNIGHIQLEFRTANSQQIFTPQKRRNPHEHWVFWYN